MATSANSCTHHTTLNIFLSSFSFLSPPPKNVIYSHAARMLRPYIVTAPVISVSVYTERQLMPVIIYSDPYYLSSGEKSVMKYLLRRKNMAEKITVLILRKKHFVS